MVFSILYFFIANVESMALMSAAKMATVAQYARLGIPYITEK